MGTHYATVVHPRPRRSAWAVMLALVALGGCLEVDPIYGESYTDSAGTTASGSATTSSTCGDGFLDDGEECDDGEDGVGVDSPGCTECMVVEGWECFPDGQAMHSLCGPLCGDGMWFDVTVQGVTPGFAEGCDDGNTTDGDGCDAECNVEPGCSCTGEAPGVSTCSC